MSNYRRGARLTAVAAVGVLALAACGGGNGDGSSGTGAAEFNAAVTGVVSPSEVTGGTLNLGSGGDCDSWDPGRQYYGWCLNMGRLYYRTLMAFKPVPGEDSFDVVPDLAQAPGEANPDQTVWTYHLRPGLTYEDGTPITTKDIKYAIQRLYATGVINGGPSPYYWCLLDECVDGAAKYKGPYDDPDGDLPRIETPDDTTIVFNLTQPYADFDYLMALGTAAPLPADKDDGEDYAQHPVSSGPYKIESYDPGKSITFVRNENWSQASDTVRKPKVDKVELTMFSNRDDLDQRVLAGTIDALADNGFKAAAITQTLNDPNKKKYADNPVEPATQYIVLASSVPPLDNIDCRKAIFYAINKKALLAANGGDSQGTIANSMTPIGVPGYEPDYDPYPTGPDGTGDLAKARESLAACGHPDGFDVNMTYIAGSVTDEQNFAAVQESLGRVGIKVTAKPGEQSVYYTTWIGSPQNIVDQKLGILGAGWGADFPSINGFYRSIAHGDSILPTGNSNYASLDDPEVNRLMDDALRASPDQQEDIGKQLNHRLMDLAVMLPTRFSKDIYYRSSRLTNVYALYSFFSLYDFVQVGVSDGK
ncbi:MAG TPA: ABC transporter substrate-binding protein [Jiangellaceae bacterium]|nr:ABC transporter substrate-binding protein [Jiangellaceae bacterium]